ncbi:MAG TPA: hypothetical protein VMS11_00855 [Solirubrobacterales bacterium]|nr:hypothetical protein [Solirubrobacterales bacterium]
MELKAQRVTGLGGGGAVIAPAVGLDEEAQGGPEEVDFEVVDEDFGQLEGERCRERDRAKEEFQFLVREPEGVAVEDLAKPLDPGLAGIAVQSLAQLIRIDVVALVGLVDGALEAVGRFEGGVVEQGADRGGERDPVQGAQVVAG